MNTNTKFPHAPRMHHANGKYQIMGTKISGQTVIATNLSKQPKTKNVQKLVGKIIYYERSVETTMLLALGPLLTAWSKVTEAPKNQ